MATDSFYAGIQNGARRVAETASHDAPGIVTRAVLAAVRIVEGAVDRILEMSATAERRARERRNHSATPELRG
jgi:hypothetical protein